MKSRMRNYSAWIIIRNRSIVIIINVDVISHQRPFFKYISRLSSKFDTIFESVSIFSKY